MYGLLVGLAILIVFHLLEKKARQIHLFPQKISSDFFWMVLVVSLVFGVFGARVWHIATDFHIYNDLVSQQNWWSLFELWNGGLSVLGAILGAVVGMGGFVWWQKKDFSLAFIFLDLAAFALPFGQAVGRFANFVNQELYGAPSSLPWALFIDPENRLRGYENFTRFHPLFFYEALCMLGFGALVWWYHSKKKESLGTGKYFFWYLGFYASLRFLLDFLRIDFLPFWGRLGINQVVLICLLVVLGVLGGLKHLQRRGKAV